MYKDYIVVGAGPAGIQAAIFLSEKSADYVVLERNHQVATHFRNYPRHRQLISINKRFTGCDDPDFNLRHDWNSLLTTNPEQPLFTAYSKQLYPSADTLCNYLDDVVKSHNLNIRTGVAVAKISKGSDNLFHLQTSKGTYTCKHLLVATGGAPWYPNIQGIDNPCVDTYEHVSLDKEEFQDRRVLIIGKGNSAFECAEYLSEVAAVIHLVSPRQITFAWNSRYVGDLRSIRNNILDMYQLKSQFAILNANISRISHNPEDAHPITVDFQFSFTPEDPNNSISYDKVIACTGFGYLNADMFDRESVPIEVDPRDSLRGKFPLITSEWQYVNAPGMYALGAMMQTVNYRKNAGGFIHGFRYTIRSLIDILFFKEHGHPLRSSQLISVDSIKSELMRRINSASSLYQMYGELCDVLVIDSTGNGDYCYYYDLPLSFVKSHFVGHKLIVLTFSILPRPNGEDAFTHVPVATPATPELSIFIHPLLEVLSPEGANIDQLHLLENIDISWTDPLLHIKPVNDLLLKHITHATQDITKMTNLTQASV